MGKILKAKRKISIPELLGIDAHDPGMKNFLEFKDFIVGLNHVMVKKGISKNELARRMKVSRQAIYDKFSGRNLTMKWIQRACDAIGVTIRISLVDKRKAA